MMTRIPGVHSTKLETAVIGGRKALVTPKCQRVVGSQHRNAKAPHRQEIIRTMQVGDLVELVREPQNPHDPSAVAVHFQGELSGSIGYMPRELAALLSPALDSGTVLGGLVESIGKNTYGKLTVDVKIFEWADD